MNPKEGDFCPLCGEKFYTVTRADFRDDDTKEKYPLTQEELEILACRCLHPGDFYVGGFF